MNDEDCKKLAFFLLRRSAISGTGLCKNGGHSNSLQLSDLLIVSFFVLFFSSCFPISFWAIEKRCHSFNERVYGSIDVPTIRVCVPIQFIIDQTFPCSKMQFIFHLLSVIIRFVNRSAIAQLGS